MDNNVITIPKSDEKILGFSQSQFRKLDGLYLKAVSQKTLTYRTVECDFEEGMASYTYYQAAHHSPYLQFLIRKVGPRTIMYEVYLQGNGRILKSSLFDKALNKLNDEISKL